MSTQYELEYDDHTILIGEVKLVCDDAPGGSPLEKTYSLEFESFHVVVYIRGIDYTATFAQKHMDAFKESFRAHVMNKYLDDLKHAHLSDRLDDDGPEAA